MSYVKDNTVVREKTTKTLTALVCGLFFASVSAYSKAEPYVVAGLGQSKTCHTGLDGCWYQSPWEYKLDERANTWHIGLGQTDLFNLDWLSGEVRYHDLGEYNIFSGVGPDDRHFNPHQPDGCNGTCPETVYAYGHADIKALSFSAMPEYDFGPFSLYARLGVARVSAKYEVRYSNKNKDYAKVLRAYEPGRYMMWQPQYGAGVRVGNFSLEYTEISPMRPEDSCIAKSKSYTVSHRWMF